MNEPNIVLNIIEKSENNDKVEEDNNQKQNLTSKQKTTNVEKNNNDTNINLTYEQKIKLQSWINSEEECEYELKKLQMEHEKLFKQIDSRIENNNNNKHMKSLMNNILKTKTKTKTKNSFYQKPNLSKQKSVIKPYGLKLF